MFAENEVKSGAKVCDGFRMGDRMREMESPGAGPRVEILFPKQQPAMNSLVEPS
jgi:hypothetical protein